MKTSDKGKEPTLAILRAVQNGSVRAAMLFDRATGGCRLHEACESLLTAGIFERLAKLRGVTHLEVPVRLCRQEAKAVRCGKPSRADRLNGRYDIVHYWVNGLPRAAIEVKNAIKHLNRASFESDFARLANTLTASNDSSYQFCAFVYYVTADYHQKGDFTAAKKQARARLERIASGVKKLAEEFVQHRNRKLIRRHYVSSTRYSADRDEGAWYVGIVIFAGAGSAQMFPNALFD